MADKPDIHMDDQIEEIKRTEDEVFAVLNEIKSIVGWPLVGDQPTKPSSMSDREFAEESKMILARWKMFLDTMVKILHQARDGANARYSHYRGEKKVPPKKIEMGTTISDVVNPGRKLDLG